MSSREIEEIEKDKCYQIELASTWTMFKHTLNMFSWSFCWSNKIENDKTKARNSIDIELDASTWLRREKSILILDRDQPAHRDEKPKLKVIWSVSRSYPLISHLRRDAGACWYSFA